MISYIYIYARIYSNFGSLGIADRQLSLLATRKNADKGGNSCRRLHGFAVKMGKRLPVKEKYVKTPIRTVTKAKVHEVETDFPTLPLSSWMQTSFDLGGHFFLGGKSTECFEEFSKMLDSWWTNYKKLDPNHPFFNDFGEAYFHVSFPIAVHGDEGRGRYKRPIMIFSYQPLITNFDGRVNLKGSVCPKKCLNFNSQTIHFFLGWNLIPHNFLKHFDFIIYIICSRA